MDEDGFEEEKPGKELVKVDGQVAIGAGGDTALMTLAHLWYFLLKNPQYMQKLKKEVDEYFPPEEEFVMDVAKVSGMPYLNVVVYVSVSCITLLTITEHITQ